MNNNFIVYKMTNIINDKVYIGQTCETLERRFNRHVGYQAIDNNTKIHQAIREYGKDSFIIEQIDTAVDQADLDLKEVYWIKYYNSVKNGYNIKSSLGKCGGDTLTNHPNLKNIRNKLSQSKIGNKNPNASKVRATNINTNEVIDFDCMKKCQIYFGLKHHAPISRRCRGVTKKLFLNEWIFQYI